MTITAPPFLLLAAPVIDAQFKPIDSFDATLLPALIAGYSDDRFN
jgi:hypothetical protein